MKHCLLLFLTLSTSAFAGDWADALRADAAEVRAASPALAARIDSLQPIRNRAGRFFFPGKGLVGAAAQTLLAERLFFGTDESEIQVALAYSLATPVAWPTIERQSEPVRVALIQGYKRVPDEAVYLAAMADESSAVVGETVRMLGYAGEIESPLLTQQLVASLKHDSGEVRRLAARSLGWLGEQDAFGPLQPLLRDERPGVTEAAVRALGLLDPKQARSLPALIGLAQDPHPGTRRAVKKILQN
jgi:HEAT repeat protein